MPKITPRMMITQWANAPHQFSVNVHNFEVEAGKLAVETFKESFDKHRMNTSGSRRWAPWQGSYSGKGSLMDETGTLKNSIKVKEIKNHKIHIWTDPGAFHSSARHQGFCYAAVHNNLESLSIKPAKGPKKERQFIGHSTVLEHKLKQQSVHLFDGLP